MELSRRDFDLDDSRFPDDPDSLNARRCTLHVNREHPRTIWQEIWVSACFEWSDSAGIPLGNTCVEPRRESRGSGQLNVINVNGYCASGSSLLQGRLCYGLIMNLEEVFSRSSQVSSSSFQRYFKSWSLANGASLKMSLKISRQTLLAPIEQNCGSFDTLLDTQVFIVCEHFLSNLPANLWQWK